MKVRTIDGTHDWKVVDVREGQEVTVCRGDLFACLRYAKVAQTWPELASLR